MTRKTTARSTKKTTSRGTKKAAPKRSAKKKAAPKARGRTKAKPAKMTALEAAAHVLSESSEPLSSGVLVQRMLDEGYWSTKGATPANTLYAALLREITRKGKASRFKKVGRGLFALT